MTRQEYLKRLSSIDKKLDEIVRDEKRSDYEKIIAIEAYICYPMVDEIRDLEEKKGC